MQPDIHDLTERVHRLENENRRLKRWSLAGVALIGVIGLASATSAACKTVWAERFVLQDSNGRERAVMTAYETGGVPTWTMFDAKGNKALTFGVTEAGKSYVEIPGAEGMVRSHFAVSPEGHATIEKGKEVALAR